ncbi:Glutathione-dependent formaldehyde-activating enzyme [Pseudovibrio sp. Ad46]|uniref:GFA family protein n=1 Tax=Pseudovibrio sp. Ad46 TaxID=989432 RepID=UPI0007AEDA8C|nr:GFA family protein [Pseudovibrio sp. Ad46]KZK93806.1 Glutathione-dependent formaldehyde-activating enzyme [Pseudovibrio sp. Ad46]
MITGKCDCGKVSFQVEEVRDTVTICHCSQCRRTSGHVWASTHAPSEELSFIADEGLTWYASSDFAKRGFCKFCGSSLFYKMNDKNNIAIAAGCLDAPTNLKISKHIFVKDKGDYYEITDGAPQIEKF